ncbi:FecR family protein [Flammeovirga sp. SubArs3]|uniref:FecR family protein n=1 Tax=Flammeovirga sp. SubArs3 TaxID=2995316 RepID=UPI00248ACE7E|nr:FecR family protein [Flammeovirga sp. SubArs3]
MIPENDHEFIDKALKHYDQESTSNKDQVDDNSDKELSLLNKVSDELSNMSIPTSKKSKEQSWSEIYGKINSETVKQAEASFIDMLFSPKYMKKVAAIAGVFVGLYAMWFFLSGIQNVTPSDGTLEYTFPDGSTVFLKKGSNIRYLKSGFDGNVYLNGHAQFHLNAVHEGGVSYEVKTDRSIILADAGSIFDVRDDSYLYHITNIGRPLVQVRTPHQDEATSNILLKKGNSLKTKSAELGDVLQGDLTHINWPKGHFIYHEVPLSMVLFDFENQFGVKVVHSLPELSNKVFSGSFKDENINAALSDLTKDLALNFRLEGESVILSDINN